MNITLVYVSPNGTTKRVADLLSEALRQRGHTVTALNLGDRENRQPGAVLRLAAGADLLGLGSPVYHMTLLEPMEAFLRCGLPELARQNPDLKAFAYLTYAGITSGRAFLNAARLCMRCGVGFLGGAKVKAPHFYEPDGFPDDAARQTVRLLADRLGPELRKMDHKQIRRTFGHQKAIVRLLYPLAQLIGKRREQPITIKADACTGCGLCARRCPAGAISVNAAAVHDPAKCLYCYHCAVCCPKHAVTADTDAVRRAVRLNKKIVGTEEPPNAVYVEPGIK